MAAETLANEADGFDLNGKGSFEQALIKVFVFGPFLAVLAAGFVVWGGWLSWRDVVIAAFFFWVTRGGVGVGNHRYFTHGSFKAKRWLKITLAVASSLAFEGPLFTWVADHRKHHAFSDKEGDPHSPWRFGDSGWALAKGFFFAHMGWILGDREKTDQQRYIPDLLEDRDLRWISKHFKLFVIISLLAPATIGGLWSWSWQGALTGFFWGALVRIAAMHHVTWSINSICHTVGKRQFNSRDKSRNVGANILFWPFVILAGGENWHNLHHADPTCARHGVLRGQIDEHARIIWILEKCHAAYHVKWPKPARVAGLRVTPV